MSNHQQQGYISSDALAGFLAIGFIFAFVVLAVIFNGFVLKVLWGWFMTPTFKLPELNIPQALGIALVMQTFIPTAYAGKTNWVPFLTGALTLALGWIVHLFM